MFAATGADGAAGAAGVPGAAAVGAATVSTVVTGFVPRILKAMTPIATTRTTAMPMTA